MAENLLNLSTLFSGNSVAFNAEGAGLNYGLSINTSSPSFAPYNAASSDPFIQAARGQLITNLIPYDYSALSQQTNGLYLTVSGFDSIVYCFMRSSEFEAPAGTNTGAPVRFAFFDSNKTPLGYTVLTEDGRNPCCTYQINDNGTIIAVDPTSSTATRNAPQNWPQVKYIRFNCYPNSTNSNLADDNLITTQSISNFQLFRGNTLAKTTADRLQKIIDTKAALKTALNSKGCNITTTTPFAEYAVQAANIQTGITPTGTIDITTNGTVDVTNYAAANVNVASDYNVKMLDTNLASNSAYNISAFITKLPDTISVIAGDRNYLFQNLRRIHKLPSIINDSNITYADSFADGCDSLGVVPSYNMSKCTSFARAFAAINPATGLTMGTIDMSAATNIANMFQASYPEVQTVIGGFPNLGKAYLTTVPANNANYRLNLQTLETLTEQSAINILNSLYDIKTKGCNTQQVYFINLATDNFTSTEYAQAVANATAKGWTVRIIED